MSYERLIAVARGQEPADLVLRDASVVNVFIARIERADIAVAEGRVAGVGDGYQGQQNIELGGRYVLPGFIDGHVHPESSLLSIGEYARAVVPRGTTAIVTDLHEVANVLGLRGARRILNMARRIPLDIYFMVPSCVPATHLETAGAEVGADEVKRALRWWETIGLGEMMNYPGVLYHDSTVMAKLDAARAWPIDGHAPGLSGRDLAAYVAAGISSDHETTTLDEGLEKLRQGMYLMIREGSSEKNLEALLPLVDDQLWHRCLLVVDDRSCLDLLADGDMDAVLRKAIALGLDPVRAVQLATINPARRFDLKEVGAVAPGYWANLLVVEDLAAMQPSMVFFNGQLVAHEGQALFHAPGVRSRALTQTFNVKAFAIDALSIREETWHHPIIEVVPDQIVTRRHDEAPKTEGGLVVSDTERDILKLAVIERHRATGNIGLGLIKGFGLRSGALASSVAHDSHNIVVVGVTDEDIYAAANEVINIQGGLVVVAGGQVRGSLPLPVAGLMSQDPLEAVARRLESLQAMARELGCNLEAPFATLSFMALPVIPELRLTDLGLVDVNAFRILT